MQDDEQGAAGGHGPCGGTQDRLLVECGRGLQVMGTHQVEGALGERGSQLVAFPGDAVADPGLGRVPGRALQGGGGDVHAGDPPAARGQPHGVRPFAAAEVERGAGDEAGRLLDQQVVGAPAPDAAGVAVAGLPELRGGRRRGGVGHGAS